MIMITRMDNLDMQIGPLYSRARYFIYKGEIFLGKSEQFTGNLAVCTSQIALSRIPG